MKNQYRQGDVLIEAVETIPAGAIPVENKIIALGEFSGHGHVVTGEGALLEIPETGEMFIDVPNEAAVEHLYVSTGQPAEHGTIPLQKGKYRVRLQRQYDPFQKTIERNND